MSQQNVKQHAKLNKLDCVVAVLNDLSWEHHRHVL